MFLQIEMNMWILPRSLLSEKRWIHLNKFWQTLDSIISKLGNSMLDWINYLDDTNIGLNVAVRVIMIAVSVSVITFLFRRMLKSQIKESAFLMWTLPAALLFIYGVWPELTYYVADLTHMAYGYALVVTVPFIALLYYIAFKYMCQIAALTSKVVELGSMVSLQKHEIDNLKKQVAAMKSDNTLSDNSPAANPAQSHNEHSASGNDVEITVI